MKLELQRFEYGTDYTVGRLFVDGVYQCFVLEDVVRTDEKVYGKTAIPVGEYTVLLNYSPKYKRIMPQVINVPGFEGIRIHSGNTSLDTEGCLLVGDTWTAGNLITNSRVAYQKLLTKLSDTKEPITICIK